MARAVKFTNPIDQEIYEMHRRYIDAMEGGRLTSLSEETRGHYLRVLKTLTEKLEIPGKPISEIVGEIMAAAAPMLFRAMQR